MISSYHRVRGLFSIAVAAALLLFYALAKLVWFPSQPGFDGLLWTQPSLAVKALVLIIGFYVSIVLSSAVAGSVRRDAGLAASGLGLAIWALRGGTLQSVLHQWPAASIYLSMFFELLFYLALFAGGSRLLDIFEKSRRLRPDALIDGVAGQMDCVNTRLLAMATQIVVTAAVLALFCQSDSIKQTLACVALAGWCGAAAAHSLFTVSGAIWYWPGTLVVGMIGYLLAYMNPDGLAVGEIHGTLAGLARPLPLHYAAMGPAAAMAGYWMSRRWQRARIAEVGAA